MAYLVILDTSYIFPASYLIFSISALLGARSGRVASLSIKLAISIQPSLWSRWQIDCALVKSTKKDICLGFDVPAFSSLLTWQISLWFFPIVFDKIPTHFIAQNLQQTAVEIDITKLILTLLHGILFNNNTKKNMM